MPGWRFTGYRIAEFFAQLLITEEQYKEIMEDFMNTYPESRERYNDLIKQYDFSNGVPKYKVFVKVNETISADRRDFIANGIRSFFKDD